VPFLSFKKAVAIVRAAELKSQKQWRIWSKTKRPKNIPGNPSKVYKKQWKDWAYWLGADLARTNLTDKERRAIAEAIASGMSTSAICKKFGRGPTTVSRIRRGKR
jgi:DNA-binding NarL/FixJ family response regulator